MQILALFAMAKVNGTRDCDVVTINCYCILGGPLTVTDANLCLGRLIPK